jgi:D-alanine-D-alanine ligase-like ATP-grasp enzyme
MEQIFYFPFSKEAYMSIYRQANKGGEVTHFVIHADTIYRKHCTKGADHLTLGGGGGGKISKKIFLQPKEKERKNHAAYNREKKYLAKESAQKNIPACKSTEAFHFSIVSTGLKDFAFLSS